MKISLITTVLNEEKAIDEFLTSLDQQTFFPDELIIVDGGSTDTTIEKVKSFQFKNYKNPVHVRIKRGNRAVGRNHAIKYASYELIACSDVGCLLDKNWLKKITQPILFENKEVVAGFYKPLTNSVFQKSLAAYTCVMEDKVDEKKFLPSSRSIAFLKSVWQKVGGYPEYLPTCEDLMFAKKLKERGYQQVFVKDAIVLWKQKDNIVDAFWQFFQYAIGDGMAHYFRAATPLLFLRYLVGFIFVVIALKFKVMLLYWLIAFLFTGYCIWAIAKNYKYVGNIQAFYILPALQLTSDIAVISGMIIGMIKRVWVTQKK